VGRTAFPRDAGDAAAGEAPRPVTSWGGAARALRPFGFFVRLLEAECVRGAAAHRLGAEVDDPRDESRFSPRPSNAPTGAMQGSSAVRGGRVEIKRDMDKGAATRCASHRSGAKGC
jgi:hypothetical protein